MLHFILERLPTGFSLFLTVMVAVVPFVVYKVNRWLHQQGDPPWKKQSP